MESYIIWVIIHLKKTRDLWDDPLSSCTGCSYGALGRRAQDARRAGCTQLGTRGGSEKCGVKGRISWGFI